MAKLMAKCFYCGERFDRNQEEWVAVNSRRYAHKKCHEEKENTKTQEEKDYEKLIKYIKNKFGYSSLPVRVNKQINDYKKEYNFTYSGMFKALTWWFDIQNHTIEKANGGIGILPYIYNDAKTYFYGLYLAQLANEEKTIYNQIEEIEIASPRVYISPPKLFDIEEENNE